MQGKDLTYLDVADIATKHLAAAHDLSRPEAERAEAKRRLDELRSLYSVWHTDPDDDVRGLALRLDTAIDFAQRRKDPANEPLREQHRREMGATYGSQFAYDEGSPQLHELGITPFSGPSLVRPDGSIVAGAHEEGSFFSSLFGEPEGIEVPKSLSAKLAGLGSPEAARRAYLLDSSVPVQRREDGSPFIDMGDGVQQDLYDIRPGREVQFLMPDGGTRNVPITQSVIEEIESSKQGGLLGTGLEGTALRYPFYGSDWVADTARGRMMVPNVLGNPLLDKAMMRDPVYLRSLEEADRGSSTKQFIRSATQMATMGAGVFATNLVGAGALRVIGASGKALASSMKVGGGLTAPTARAWRAAFEGGASAATRTAPPGFNFDYRMIPEMAWYDVVTGAVTGQGTPADWVKSGLQTGGAGLALGSTARATRHVWGKIVRSNKWDFIAGKVSAQKWGDLPAKHKAWLTKFDDTERSLIAGAISEVQAARSSLHADLIAHAEAALSKPLKSVAQRKFYAALSDTAFVMSQFGAYGAARRLAGEDGRDWGSISWSEKVGYYKDAWATGEPYAAAVGGMAWHGAHHWATKSRASEIQLTEEQKQSVRDSAELVVKMARGTGTRDQTALGILTMQDMVLDSMTPEQLQASLADSDNIELGRPGDPTIPDIGARPWEVLLERYKREGGAALVRQVVAALSPVELDSIEAGLRNLDPKTNPDRVTAGGILEMLRSERVAREQAKAPVSLPEEEVPGRVSVQRPGKPERVDLPPEEWPKEFREEVRHLGPAEDRRAVRIWVSPNRYRVVETQLPDGTRGYVVASGRHLRLAKGSVLYPYTPDGLRRAQGVALVKAGRLEASDQLKYELGLRKNPPPILQAVDPASLARVTPEAAQVAEVVAAKIDERKEQTEDRAAAQAKKARKKKAPKKKPTKKTSPIPSEAAAEAEFKALTPEEQAAEIGTAPIGPELTGQMQPLPDAEVASLHAQFDASVERYHELPDGHPERDAAKRSATAIGEFLGLDVQFYLDVDGDARATLIPEPEPEAPPAFDVAPEQAPPPKVEPLRPPPTSERAMAAGLEVGAKAFSPSAVEGQGAGIVAAAELAIMAHASAPTQAGHIERLSAVRGMVQGMLLSTGAVAPTKASEGPWHKFIAAIAGIEPGQVLAERNALVEAGAANDRHIDEVLAKMVDSNGKRLLTETQAKRSDTRDLLRIISLGKLDAARAGETSRPGRPALERVQKWWDKGGKEQTSASLVQSGLTPDKADVHAERLFTVYLEALRGTIGKEAPMSDVVGLLQQRIATSILGKDKQRAAASTALPSMGGKTLGDVALDLAAALSRSEVQRKSASVSRRGEGMPADGGAAEHIMGGEVAKALERSEAEISRREASTSVEDHVQLYRRASDEARVALDSLAELKGPDGDFLIERDADGIPLTDWSNPQRGQIARRLMRALVSEDAGLKALFDRQFGDMAGEVWQEAATSAKNVERYAQHFIRATATAAHGEVGQRAVDAAFEGLAFEGRYKGEPLSADLKARLAEKSPIFPDGMLSADGKRVGPFVPLELAMLLRRSMLDAAAEGRASDQDFDVDLAGTDYVPMYAGVSRRSIEQVVSGALSFAAGYYDRIFASGTLVNHDRISIQAAFKGGLSGQALMRRMVEGRGFWSTRAGKSAMRFLDETKIVERWQRFMARGQSGLLTPKQKEANVQVRRLRISEESAYEHLTRQVHAIMDRMERLKVTPFESNLLGKLQAGNAIRRIRTKDRFVERFGQKRGYLWDLLIDINTMFVEMGDDLAAVGAIEQAAADVNRDHYLPKLILRTRSDLEGRVHRELSVWGSTASVMPRTQPELSAEVERIYDVRYVLPTALVAQAKMRRLWNTLDGITSDTRQSVTPAEYAKMNEVERWGWVKFTEPAGGKDRKSVELLTQEERALPVSEQQAIIERRRHARTAQTKLYSLVRAERDARTGKAGAPVMTEKLDQILTQLETGYTTHNVLDEVSLMLDQTEQGRSQFESKWGDAVQDMTRYWRALRTIQSPKFWMMNNSSSLVTNSATGRLSWTDFLLPDGWYATTSRMLADYYRWNGEGRKEAERTHEISEIEELLQLSGQNHFLGQVTGGFDANAFLAEQFKRTETDDANPDSFMRNLVLSEMQRGRSVADITETVAGLRGSPDPRKQAEALHVLMEMQALHESLFKLAPARAAIARGMRPVEAVEWASKGTGDYQDRNPFIFRMTTQFTTSIGEREAMGRKRLGKTPHLGSGEKALRTMVGSPFWMYRWSMWPELAGAVVNKTGKVFGAYAAMGAAIGAISAAFGGDEKRLKEALSGHLEMVGARLEPEAIAELDRRYGNKDITFFGNLRLSMREYVSFMKAWAKGNPEKAMLARARGPGIGGDSTYLDFSEHMLVPTGISGIRDMLTGANEHKNFVGGLTPTEEVGLGFLPSLALAGTIRSFQLAWGKSAESRWETATKMALDLAAEASAPLGGGFMLSSLGQQSVRQIGWDGRSLHEIWANLPTPGLKPTTGEQLTTLGIGAVFPLRRLPRTSAASPDTTTLERFGFSGQFLRPAGQGKVELEEETVRRNTNAAIRNLLGQAYREQLETAVPVGALYAAYFDLERDVVADADGNPSGIRKNPETGLGRFVASQGADAPQYLEQVLRTIHRVLPEVERHLTGPEGLSYRTDVDPAVHDRIVKAVWRQAEDPAHMVEFLHRALVLNEDWAKGHDGIWYRMFFHADLPTKASGFEAGSPSSRRYEELVKRIEEMGVGASYDYDPRAGVEAMGGMAFDVAPMDAIQSRPLRMAAPSSYSTLFGATQ